MGFGEREQFARWLIVERNKWVDFGHSDDEGEF